MVNSSGLGKEDWDVRPSLLRMLRGSDQEKKFGKLTSREVGDICTAMRSYEVRQR
jgi:hypothetical protein